MKPNIFLFWVLSNLIRFTQADVFFSGEDYYEGTYPLIDDRAVIESDALITFYNIDQIYIAVGLMVDPDATFSITNTERFNGHYFGDGRFGSEWVVDGRVMIEAKNDAIINYYEVNVDTFDNAGLTSIHADGQSDYLHVKLDADVFVNSETFAIQKDKPGVAVLDFSYGGAAQNLGSICLRNTQFMNHMSIEGRGCLVLDDSFMRSMNIEITDVEHTLYMTNGAKVSENAQIAGTRWTIYGFGSGMSIGLSDTIAEGWSYTPATGILRIVSLNYGAAHSFTIGTGYDAELFRVIDDGAMIGNAITYDGATPAQDIPAACLGCPFVDTEEEYTRVNNVDPSQSTHYVTTYAEQDTVGIPYLITALVLQSTALEDSMATESYTGVTGADTLTERITVDGNDVYDVQIARYGFEEGSIYDVSSTIIYEDFSFTTTIDESLALVMFTSNEENWWHTTTSFITAITDKITVSDDDLGTATHIVYASVNEEGEWITSTSTYTPELESQTRLTTYTTNIDEEEVTITGLFEKSTNEAGAWASATFEEAGERATFTERIINEIDGIAQTKDAEVVGYDYGEYGMYYLTSILADPVEARYTITVDEEDGEYTGVVRVTSDEENWWFTTTDILSSYTSTYTINDDFEQATHIVYASANEEGEWITSTSTHTPESQTRLTTYTTNIDEEEVTITGLFEISTNEAGAWASATFEEAGERTTFTERIVTEIDGISQTKDAEVVGYNYGEYGMYYLTSILADPVGARYTITTDGEEGEYTGVVRVTSDEENWWYTTTDILSSYTSTYTINDDLEQATHIVYASVNEEGEWITSTSTHTPESQTRLTTYVTGVGEEEVTITGLFEKSTNEAGAWASATFEEAGERTTFTERIVTEIDGISQTKDAEVVGYNYGEYGMYYLTSILADPVGARYTITTDGEEGEYTGVVRVTSDEENWWY
ncbi:uncharacterized protein KGF55_003982, partial [Candida pseudojiufengensis]|uniref:uncharacterized protein n=1 Tax=Candida pseudojiufengensis TaxID=497109 RepID=UPI002224CAD2